MPGSNVPDKLAKLIEFLARSKESSEALTFQDLISTIYALNASDWDVDNTLIHSDSFHPEFQKTYSRKVFENMIPELSSNLAWIDFLAIIDSRFEQKETIDLTTNNQLSNLDM
jgi:hypothetical protein